MTLKLMAAGAALTALLAAADLQPINDLPNPFRTVRDWAQPPGGAPWAAVTAVEVAPDGSVFVIHRCHDNSCVGRNEPPILRFDKNGKLLASWGAGAFNFPHGATVDGGGNLWVTDSQFQNNGKGQAVYKFDRTGKIVMTLGKPGVTSAEPGLFDEPTDIAIAGNGDIFVTEGHVGGTPGNQRVSKFSKDGKFIKSWGHEGKGPGEFENPHTIAIDSRGRLLVGDRSNNRIQIFDSEGKFLEEWRQFGRPSGIFIAKDGSVKYFIEDMESTTVEHSGAEGVGVDAEGNVYGAVVRRQMLEKHLKTK